MLDPYTRCVCVSDVVGELYLAGVCGVVDQVLGLKMGSSLCCESCLRALCSLLCAKVDRLSSPPFHNCLIVGCILVYVFIYVCIC